MPFTASTAGGRSAGSAAASAHRVAIASSSEMQFDALKADDGPSLEVASADVGSPPIDAGGPS